MIKFGFWINAISAGINLFLITVGAATISTYVFIILNLAFTLFYVMNYACEIGLHDWGNWEPFAFTDMKRKCKDCGKTQID